MEDPCAEADKTAGTRQTIKDTVWKRVANRHHQRGTQRVIKRHREVRGNWPQVQHMRNWGTQSPRQEVTHLRSWNHIQGQWDYKIKQETEKTKRFEINKLKSDRTSHSVQLSAFHHFFLMSVKTTQSIPQGISITLIIFLSPKIDHSCFPPGDGVGQGVESVFVGANCLFTAAAGWKGRLQIVTCSCAWLPVGYYVWFLARFSFCGYALCLTLRLSQKDNTLF